MIDDLKSIASKDDLYRLSINLIDCWCHGQMSLRARYVIVFKSGCIVMSCKIRSVPTLPILLVVTFTKDVFKFVDDRKTLLSNDVFDVSTLLKFDCLIGKPNHYLTL